MVCGKFTIFCLSLILLVINPQIDVCAADQAKRIAVLPFSFHDPSDDVGDVDVGAEMAKVLAAKIANLPGWTTVDQKEVWALLQREDTADWNGTQIGKALGADAIITGAVQAFEFQVREGAGSVAAGTAASAAETAAYSASSYVPYVGALAGLLGSVPLSSSERGHAKVVVDAKLIDVYSGNTISTLNGTATSRKGAGDLWGNGGPNPDFLSISFTNSIAGQATSSALDAICKQLETAGPQVEALAVNRAIGTIADVDNGLICLGLGKESGLKIGDRFIIERQSITDDSRTRIGVISVTDVADQTSLAKLVEGTMPIAGDSICNDGANSPRLAAISSKPTRKFDTDKISSSSLPTNVDSKRSNKDQSTANNDMTDGKSYAQSGQYEKAIESFSKVIILDNNNAEAYNNRSIAYIKLKQYANAIQDSSKAIALKPDCAAAYRNRAIAYGKSGEHEKAIADYSQAIKLQPNEASYYRGRGTAYAKVKQCSKAIDDYSKAIGLNAKDEDAYCNRGAVYIMLGEYEKSIADLSKAIDLNSQLLDAYHMRAQAYDKLGQHDLADRDSRKEKEISSK